MSLTRPQPEWSKRIVDHCSRCKTGALEVHDSYRARCWHPHHPGLMGGCGTEWAERCSDFVDMGKVGRIVRTETVKR